MNTDNKELVDSTATNDIDGSCLIDPDNIGSIPLLQLYCQQARLRGLVKHRATIMTPEQIQRLQACVKEIAAILQEQTLATRTEH